MSYGETVSSVVRPAMPGDVPAIARIYGWAVRESIATFDVTDPPLSYWQQKLASVGSGDHVVVVEDAETVVGYAYSTQFRSRPLRGDETGDSDEQEDRTDRGCGLLHGGGRPGRGRCRV